MTRSILARQSRITVTVSEVELTVGQSLTAVVDDERRWAIRRNHSATHLIHAALRKFWVTTLLQKGLVGADETTFAVSILPIHKR